MKIAEVKESHWNKQANAAVLWQEKKMENSSFLIAFQQQQWTKHKINLLLRKHSCPVDTFFSPLVL